MKKSSLLVVMLVVLLGSYFYLFPASNTRASEQPALVKAVGGIYPTLARTARISDKVIIEVTIDKTGAVTATSVVEGHPLLKKAAEETAKQWLFSASQTDESRKVKITLTYKMADTNADKDLVPVFTAPYEFEIKGKSPLFETTH